MLPLPDAFLNRMRKQFDANAYDAFVAAYESPAPLSVRLNPFKGLPDLFNECPKVPWAAEGRYLEGKTRFIDKPLWHAGAFYVQEASSMALAAIYQQLFPDGKAPVRALDLCAAPGGKSTHLQSLLPVSSLLVANEVIGSRVAILKENHIRLGLHDNLLITQGDPKRFGELEAMFDYIQVDAPCSGEGMFRRNDKALSEWSEQNGAFCAARQKRILSQVLPSLSQGGILVYSTCTFNPEENEEMMAWACKSFNLQSIHLSFPGEWGISPVKSGAAEGYYFYPHRVKGEGLFYAVLQKRNGQALSKLKTASRSIAPQIEALPYSTQLQVRQNHYFLASEALLALEASLKKKVSIHYLGLELGELKGKSFIPSQALANDHQGRHHLPKIEVDEAQALAFFRGGDPHLETTENGFHELVFQGLGLGWVKVIGSRVNNYYPKPWRIKNY